MPILAQISTILKKDLVLEMRDKQVITAILVFALVIVVVFEFIFEPGADQIAGIVPGVIWVVIVFSGTLCFNRSFSREQESGKLQGLILCPIDKSYIYVAKLAANIAYLLIMEAIVLPVMTVLFDLQLLHIIGPLALVLFLGTAGFAAIGTLFAAISCHSKSSEVMLPILLFPVSVPIVLSASKSTAALLRGQEINTILSWLKILIGFDIVFIVVCFLLYEYVLEE
jgi:heme exporter protein B